jgi:hypothetical protein
MKFLGIDFGSQRPSESSLKSVIDASDERLGQNSTFQYTPDTVGEVSLDDLAKGSTLDSEQALDSGFEPRPVLGGTKTPW